MCRGLQVRKRALDHIREAQGDLKERAQVEFDQRVQAERDMLVRELWGVDADKARRTRIGQAMMHKVEQLARQSVLRQLNLEAEYVNVKELGFAQVISPRGMHAPFFSLPSPHALPSIFGTPDLYPWEKSMCSRSSFPFDSWTPLLYLPVPRHGRLDVTVQSN